MSSHVDSPEEPGSTPPDESREGGPLASILIGLGVVGIVAVLAFLGSSGPRSDDTSVSSAPSEDASDLDLDRSGYAPGAGGVGARHVDDPSRPPLPQPKVNRAMLAEGIEVSAEPPAPPAPPPDFANVDEAIAWYQHKLDQARHQELARKTFVERIPRARERLERNPDARDQLERFEARKQIVEDNYAKAQAKVAELEEKLEELKSGKQVL